MLDLPPSEVWYEADEGQVRQIVWNLATNGLRAMPDGGRLTLAAGYEQIAAAAVGLPSNVVFSVRDEGVGIPPEELDQIFQPFRGAFERGTGLGLAIVHRIVSDYGGEVQVSSQPGQRHHRQGAPAGPRRDRAFMTSQPTPREPT